MATIPALDQETLSLVRSIRDAHGYDEVVELRACLDRHLFSRYCAKPYLEEVDVPYCAYVQTGTCGYINLLKVIDDEYGINVVTRTRT